MDGEIYPKKPFRQRESPCFSSGRTSFGHCFRGSYSKTLEFAENCFCEKV